MRTRLVSLASTLLTVLFVSTSLALASTVTSLNAQNSDELIGFSSHQTDDGKLRIQVPDTWGDVESGEWIIDDEDFGTLIQASVDLELFYSDRSIPGMVIGFTQNPVPDMAELLLLDWIDVRDECTFDDSTSFELILQDAGEGVQLPAFYNQYTDCGDNDTILYVLEAISDSYGFFIVAQSSPNPEGASLAAISFQILEVDPIQPSGTQPAESSTTESNARQGRNDQLATDDGAIRLELNWTAGTRSTQRTIIDQTIIQTLPSDSQTLEQRIGLGYRFFVEDVDESGTATVRVTYDWAAFSQTGNPAGDISYDSENPTAEVPPMAMGYAGLVDKGFTIQVTPKGTVANIDGVDAMLEALFDDLNLPPGPEQEAILEALIAQFGDEALATTFEQSFNIYPDDPVDIGDSWSRTFVIPSGFPMVLDNTWTLVERIDGLSTLSVSSGIKPNEDAPPMDMGGIELSYSLVGTQSGTMQIDEETGWTISAQLNQLFEGDVATDGLTIPMSITSTIVITGDVEQPSSAAQVDDATPALSTDVEPVTEPATELSTEPNTREDARSAKEETSEEAASTGNEAETSEERSSPRRANRGAVTSTDDSTEQSDAGDEGEDANSDASQEGESLEVVPTKIEVAKSLAAEGKVKAAIAAFEEALADDPSLDFDPQSATVAAMIEAGEALYIEDKTWQALQLYSAALELDPTSADAYIGRASVYRWFEEYEKALDDLSSAIELGYDSYNYATAYSERGYIYYQQGENSRAVADLTRAINAQSAAGERAVAWHYELRGYAYSEQGVAEEAIADFTAALEVDEADYNYKWTYINRAANHRDLNDLEAALVDATSAIEIDPGYTWGYELRGRIYSDLGDNEKSIADLSKAIGFKQDDYDYSIAYGYRGYGYYQLDEYFDAVTDLTSAIELFPKYTWAYETRGDAHSANEQREEAIADYTAALDLTSEGYDYSSTFASRGIAYYEMEAYDLAIADFTEAVTLDPAYTWAYEWRGYTYADMEDYESAVQDFTTAIDIDQPNYGYQWAYSNRAQAYYNMGEYELALPDLTKSIELDDEYVWAYENRSEVYMFLGRHAEAMEDSRIVTDLDPRSAAAWNNLCWYSALLGNAADVVDSACESAVELAEQEDVPYYRDSRGVARALTGNGDGALEDFRAFVEGYGEDALRVEWIERLEAGEAPETIFDDAMIQALFEESGIPTESDLAEGEPAENEPTENEPVENNRDDSEIEKDSTDDKGRSTSLPAFTLVASDMLKAVPPMGSMLAYSKDGSFRLESPGDPLLIAIPALIDLPVEDPSDFALERLMLTANASIAQVDSHTPVTIGGLDGYETIASGTATSSGAALIVYQVVLLQEGSYITIKGLVGKEQADDFLDAFKETSRSIDIQ